MTEKARTKEEVKKDIRSLLISAPCGLSIKQLTKDYYAMVRKNIPYREYGFYNSTDFVTSLRDVVYCKNFGSELIFFGIADKSTVHIQQMVQNQKKTKLYTSIEDQSSPARKTALQIKKESMPKEVYPSALLRTGILKVVKEHPNGISISDLNEVYHSINGISMNIDPNNYKYMAKLILNMADIARLEYGRRDRKGNNLVLYPSKSLKNYQQMVAEKALLGNSVIKNKETVDTTLSLVKSVDSVTTSVSKCVTSNLDKNNNLTKKCLPSNSLQSPEKANIGKSKTCLNQKTKPVKVTSKSPERKLSSGFKPFLISKSSNSNLSNNRHNFSFPSRASTSKKAPRFQKLQNSQIKPITIIKNQIPNLTVDDVFKPVISPSCVELQKEVVEVLSGHPKGIWSVFLPELYKKKFGKAMELQCYGYFSIIEFISTMVDRVKIVRPQPSGDWIINLRNNLNGEVEGSSDSISVDLNHKVLLKDIENQIMELMKRFKDGIMCGCLEDVYLMHFGRKFPSEELGLSISEVLCKILNKLTIVQGNLVISSSSVEWEGNKKVLEATPIDAIGSGISFNPIATPMQKWGYFDVYVSNVVTPGSFSIQVVGKETTEALDILMDDLEKCYCSPEAKVYKMPAHMAKVGQICVTIYHGDKNWNRAMITKDPVGSFVEVLYVDYGDQASVSVSSLYFLKSCHHLLPAQMISARLAHLQPANMVSWNTEAKKIMLDLCRLKRLVAEVTAVDNLNKVSLFLCDTSGVEDVYINDALLAEKVATCVPDDLPEDEVQNIRMSIQQELQIEEKKKNQLLGPSAQSQQYFSMDEQSSSCLYEDDPPTYEESLHPEQQYSGNKNQESCSTMLSSSTTHLPSTSLDGDIFSDDCFSTLSQHQLIKSVSRSKYQSSQSTDSSLEGSVIDNKNSNKAGELNTSTNSDVNMPGTSTKQSSRTHDTSGPLISFSNSPTFDFNKTQSGNNNLFPVFKGSSGSKEQPSTTNFSHPQYFCKEKVPLFKCSGLKIDYCLSKPDDDESSSDDDLESVESLFIPKSSSKHTPASIKIGDKKQPALDVTGVLQKTSKSKLVKVNAKTTNSVESNGQPSTSNSEQSGNNYLSSLRGFSSDLLKLMHETLLSKRLELIEDDNKSFASMNNIQKYTKEIDEIENILEINTNSLNNNVTAPSTTEPQSPVNPPPIQSNADESHDSDEYFGVIPHDSYAPITDIFSKLGVNAGNSTLNPNSKPFCQKNSVPSKLNSSKPIPKVDNVARISPYSRVESNLPSNVVQPTRQIIVPPSVSRQLFYCCVSNSHLNVQCKCCLYVPPFHPRPVLMPTIGTSFQYINNAGNIPHQLWMPPY